MNTQRQKKVCSLLQKELSNIFLKAIRFSDSSNKLVSVTKVKISPDLSVAKVYVSIYPTKNKDEWIKGLRENTLQVKHALSQKFKNELRVIPNLTFYLDDSLDYIEKIESSLKKGKNPIKE
ncbi:MAG: 30S ribosome-binding factor RbfA [Flavobacteriaceae bacterium]